MSVREATITSTLTEKIGKLMTLAVDSKWEEVGTGLAELDEFPESDVAHYLLDGNYLSEAQEPNSDKRDCAYTILGRLNPDLVLDLYREKIIQLAIATCGMDSHPFASGRAADMLRLWDKNPSLKDQAEIILYAFAKRASREKTEESRTWLEQYQTDIPELYTYLQKLLEKPKS